MNSRKNNVSKSNTSPPGKRLDSNAWIAAAIEQLAAAGIEGVRIEVLAKQLNVTKGSFYAHFKDRDELHDSMLSYWRSRATLTLIDRMNQIDASPRARLEWLISLVIDTRARWGDDAELSIRLWAKRDDRARAVLAEVDEMRVVHLASLLVESGLEPSRARARALLIYAYMRVAPSLSVVANPDDLLVAQHMLLIGTE